MEQRGIISIFLCAFCLSGSVSAQTFEDYKRQAKREFEAYREKTQRDFSAYRDSVNAEFARYMREAWKNAMRNRLFPCRNGRNRPSRW